MFSGVQGEKGAEHTQLEAHIWTCKATDTVSVWACQPISTLNKEPGVKKKIQNKTLGALLNPPQKKILRWLEGKEKKKKSESDSYQIP